VSDRPPTGPVPDLTHRTHLIERSFGLATTIAQSIYLLPNDHDQRPPRPAGLEHLAAVLPGCGLDYATRRNTDAGLGRNPTTTALSPFLRRRLILEQEVVAAATARHGGQVAKFVEEMLCRPPSRDVSRPVLASGRTTAHVWPRQRNSWRGRPA
jgi:hypothetical protein